jgi:hypothetical protein
MSKHRLIIVVAIVLMAVVGGIGWAKYRPRPLRMVVYPTGSLTMHAQAKGDTIEFWAEGETYDPDRDGKRYWFYAILEGPTRQPLWRMVYDGPGQITKTRRHTLTPIKLPRQVVPLHLEPGQYTMFVGTYSDDTLATADGDQSPVEEELRSELIDVAGGAVIE